MANRPGQGLLGEPCATGERAELTGLGQVWDALAMVVGRVDRLPELRPTDLSARRFDEAQTAGTRAYFAALRYLAVAMDNHRALGELLEHHGLTQFAPWSLLRPMFECGFMADWILDPRDGKQRRIRGLRVEVLDEYERQRHIRAYESAPGGKELVVEAIAGRAAAVASYKADAHTLGVSYEAMRRRINVVDEIPKLSWLMRQEPGVAAAMVATWRMLSGYEHGLGWPLMHGSDVIDEVEIPGGQLVTLTVQDDAFVTAAKCCAWMVIEALTRLERLHTRT